VRPATREGVYVTTTENKRAGDRLTINKEFESFDAFIQEYVTNISRTGAFIKSKTPLPIGTKVNLRFTVIMDDMETVEGLGEVVRVEDNPPGMGVVFREISAYSKGIIDRLLTQGIPK
jgi:PilZ domain-containing protein